MKQAIFETDWLASQPVFYNEKTSEISHNINHVIDFENLEFHAEGFNNYLDFGYSILGQTPIKYVKFLPPVSRLTRDEKGALKIDSLPDPVDGMAYKTSYEEDIFHLLQESIREWENSVVGEIIIPTSGGYDSRLLNFLITDKKRIRSFTYGISKNQFDSFEVVFAKRLSEKLGTRWEWIPLDNFHQYLKDWNALFGVSTHAHGMYHYEFYNKIKLRVEGSNPFLSGIFGDIWAGNMAFKPLFTPKQLNEIGYTHGMRADPAQSKLKTKYLMREEFFEKNIKKLNDPYFQTVLTIRFKIILISYLIRVPSFFGFKPWSPFLIPEIALGMLNLPVTSRKNRAWQANFFKQHNIDFENQNILSNPENCLDLQAVCRQPLKPLQGQLLREVVSEIYVDWINFQVQQHSPIWNIFWRFRKLPWVRGAMNLLNVNDRRLEAYSAYLTLLPIQWLIKRRNTCRVGDKTT